MPAPESSLVDRIEQTLRTRIANGDYPVGSQLPSHADLAAEFGVRSPTTVRTAVNRLELARLVSGHRGRGTFVTAVEAPPERPVAREREIPWVTDFHPADQSITVALTLSPQPLGWRSAWFAGELEQLGKTGEFPRPGGRAQISFRVDHRRLEDLVEDFDALVEVQNRWFSEVEWPRRRRERRAEQIEVEVRERRAAAEEAGEDAGQAWRQSVFARAEALQADVADLSPRYAARRQPPVD